MKRIIALLLAAVCLFSFVACQSSDSNETATPKTPEIYSMKILSVNGEDITYEFYRYYYLFVKNSYEESGTEVTEEDIKEDVLNKLLYDAAVHKLLAKYSQSLTDEEIKECEEYVAMYVTAYGDVFESQLESEMNMTINVFTKMTLNEMAYNKLYTYLAEESNGKIDFSDSAVTEYMKNFKAGMHLILSVSNEKDDAEKKALMEKLYKIAELDSAFAPIMKLHNLRQDLKETEASLEEINKQIQDGKTSDELSATLKTLAAQISSLSAKITEEQNKINVAECLGSYMEKLEIYKEEIKKDIESLANSNDASLLASLNSEDTKSLAKTVCSSVVTVAEEKLGNKILDLANNKDNYGWFPADFIEAVKSFDKTSSLENANKMLEIFNGNTELKSDKTVTAIMTRFTNLVTLMTEGKTTGEYLEAIRGLNGSYEISVDIYEKSMLYLSARDAKATASELSTQSTDVYANLEAAFAVLSAPVTTFEELVIAYSEDYEAESGSVVFYLKQEDLINELRDATKDLQAGEMTEIVKSSIGYHILKLTEPDVEYFKKNEYVYYVLEDTINSESPNVEYKTEDVYSSINNEKIKEFENELTSQKNAIAAAGSSSNKTSNNDNTVLWTIVIMAITIAVVGVLAVLIITASKNEPVKSTPSKSKKHTKKK